MSYSTIGIIILVILSVWISGKEAHRSLFQNSVLSTSVLAGAFFMFISSGLYYGMKLKDDIGYILDKERLKSFSDRTSGWGDFDFDPPSSGDGIGEVIISIILWIVFSVVLVFLVYFFGLFFWTAVLFFVSMLYWIFFRALRYVFKNSKNCKGNLLKSLRFGFFYSFLYISWIYGIIFWINYIG
ncbi:MAG: hypothetical protein MUW56_00025 [Chryseobacterium sp.]|uniref:hypothetical protein n=1 Tax=Chryseobacterium sp. TaxID=1871047 RepID=UPI0025BC167F|nr:hypothetical protein [Chryseobacterium sp.]MCJ7932050.1 hypothetical protein [Chryseobacterium sp.]